MNIDLPFLSICLFWPIFSVLLLAWLVNPSVFNRWVPLVFLIEFLLTLKVLAQFDFSQTGFQWMETREWIPSLNAHLRLAVDGLSVFFLPLTALLCFWVSILSTRSSRVFTRQDFVMLAALEMATLGVYMANDLLLFLVFWELTIIPVFLLVGVTGKPTHQLRIAGQYLMAMVVSGLALLFAIIVLALNYADFHQGELSFRLEDFLSTPMAESKQRIVFFLFLVAFLIKAPIPPFHNWFVGIGFYAPFQLTGFLVGLKLGVFGLIRYALPLSPIVAKESAEVMGGVGVCVLVYAAMLALRQTNLRLILVYASISHIGLVLVGLFTFQLSALEGVFLQLINFACIGSSLFFLAGYIQQRAGSNELLHIGGLAGVAPRLTTIFFFFVLSALGFPGTSGFVAEFLIFNGTFLHHPVMAVLSLLCGVLAVAYLFVYFRSGFLGETKALMGLSGRNIDLKWQDWWLFGVPLLMIFLIGIYPSLILSWLSPVLQSWLMRFEF